jgi:hypothetical protein
MSDPWLPGQDCAPLFPLIPCAPGLPAITADGWTRTDADGYAHLAEVRREDGTFERYIDGVLDYRYTPDHP